MNESTGKLFVFCRFMSMWQYTVYLLIFRNFTADYYWLQSGKRIFQKYSEYISTFNPVLS